METKNLTQEQREFIDTLISTREAIASKKESKGFVVAGNGGDTLYTFVGEGRGYKGAALTPVSINPVIFNSERAAQREADNGTYRNGRDEVIGLQVMTAKAYFADLYDRLTKNIETAYRLFKN